MLPTPRGLDTTLGEGIPIGYLFAWERHPSWGPRVIDKGLTAEVWTLEMVRATQ